MKIFLICHLKNAQMDNIKCRIMRISFTGEHSYEINVQANYGKAFGKNVWKPVKSLISLHMELKRCTY